MLASGVQLFDDAMDVAKRVMNDRVLEHADEGARQAEYTRGETIAEPLKRSGISRVGHPHDCGR